MAYTAQKWTLTGMATELNMDRRTVGKYLKGVKPAGQKGQSKLYYLADVIASVYASPGQGETGKIIYNDERARLTKAQADEKELDVSRKNGELIDIEEVRDSWAKHVNACRSKILAMAAKIAPVIIGCNDLAEIQAKIKKEVYAALNELSIVD